MKIASLSSLSLALTFALLVSSGCKSGYEEVCFKDDDCESALVCCKTTTSPTARGRCLNPEDRCGVPPRPDAGGDAGADAGDDAATDAAMDANVDAGAECDPTNPDACGRGFCDVAACGAATGACVERPIRCDGVFEPVCGCDNRTYTSECEASRAGMSVGASGACGPVVDSGAGDTGTPGDAASDAMDATADAGDTA